MRNGRKIYFALILIFLGIIFLLDNFGFLPNIAWSAYFHFWPIYLILIGLGMLLPRTAGFRLLIGIMILLIPLVLSVTPWGQNVLGRKSNWGWNGGSYKYNYPKNQDNYSQQGNGKTYSGRYDWDKQAGIKGGSLKVDFGAGDLSIKEGSEKIAVFNYDSSFSEPIIDYDSNGEEIDLEVRNDRNADLSKIGGTANQWLFELNPSVPWNLDLNVGACKGTVDLEKVPVEKLKLSTGASSFTLKLGSLSQNTDLELEAGVSNIVLEVPETMAVRAKVEGVLTAKNNSFDNWDKKGDYYYSPGYSEDKPKMELKVSLGVGNFMLNTY